MTETPEPPKRMSIYQLQKLLERDDEDILEILPNGEIRQFTEAEKAQRAKDRPERKPLTMRENLGGEYGT